MKNTANSHFKFRFDKISFWIFILTFAIEVVIALFVTEKITRAYIGDVLVVILMYYFVKSFIKTNPVYIIISVLLFAYAVETAQHFKLVYVLGLQDNKFMSTIIGVSFSWGDILAYTIGAFICYLFEKRKVENDTTA